MRKSAAGLLAVLLTIVLAPSVRAKTETLTGTIVDLVCYTKDHANVGNAHTGMSKTCAEECAKERMPTALLTDDGKAYQIIGDFAANSNAKILPHMSHKVQLTGDVMVWANGKMFITPTDVKMVSK